MTSTTHPCELRLTALLCVGLLLTCSAPVAAQQPNSPAPAASPAEAPKVRPPDQLDSMVAPIALYPDPLLAQVLAASTYPLEIVQADRWLKANPKLKGEELTKAAAKQPWDASVQGLVAFPDALKRLNEKLDWTVELGNAFLEQQSDVLDAVQRMRMKAKQGGKLESSNEQKVEVKTIETKTIVEIQPSNPQVIYVPSYDPVVVYGAPPPIYAYPPLYYPPIGAYAATAAISFGVGVAMGAMWGGGGWGCGWGSNNTINVNNNFSRNTNVNGSRNTSVRGGNSQWQHNSQHRGAVPYGNRDTAQRYGGTARDSSGQTQRFGNNGQARSGQTGGGTNRGPQASTRDAGSGRGSADRMSGGNSDRMGNRSIENNSSQKSALGGSDSRSRTQASSNRGTSSQRQSSSRPSGGGGGGGSRSRPSGGGRRR